MVYARPSEMQKRLCNAGSRGIARLTYSLQSGENKEKLLYHIWQLSSEKYCLVLSDVMFSANTSGINCSKNSVYTFDFYSII